MPLEDTLERGGGGAMPSGVTPSKKKRLAVDDVCFRNGCKPSRIVLIEGYIVLQKIMGVFMV